MKDRRFTAMLAVVLVLAASRLPVLAEPPSARVILVLDASGSMWGRIGDRSKIEIARQVVGEILEDWDPAVHLGLTAYGHRREGDCTDIETLIPPGAIDPARMAAAVEGLNPKGKTPLSEAVIQAARELGYQQQKATVILVSDGIETCDRDPCQVARELEAAGVDFTAHVIGFDVAEADAIAQLRCLAENTGGRFTLANDAAALGAALGQAVRSARVSLRAPKWVFTGLELEVQWEGPDAPGDKIAMAPKDAAEGTLGTWAATSGGSPARLTGPATSGPHEVRYVSGADGGTLLTLEITVRGSAATLGAPASVVAGAELEVSWTGPDAAGDRIVLVAAAEPDERYFTGKHSAPTSAGSPAKLVAFTAAGDYELRYLATRGAQVLARRPIVIEPATASVAVPARVEAGYIFEVRWTGPGHQGDRIVVVEKSAREGTYSTKADFAQKATAGSPLKLTAYSEPGDYEVRYMAGVDGRTLARSPLAVTPSAARLEVPARALAGDELEVRWRGPNSPGDRIVLVKASMDEGAYFTSSDYSQPTSSGSPVRLRALPEPGDYEVRYLAGGDGKVLARANLEIAGAEQ